MRISIELPDESVKVVEGRVARHIEEGELPKRKSSGIDIDLNESASSAYGELTELVAAHTQKHSTTPQSAFPTHQQTKVGELADTIRAKLEELTELTGIPFDPALGLEEALALLSSRQEEAANSPKASKLYEQLSNLVEIRKKAGTQKQDLPNVTREMSTLPGADTQLDSLPEGSDELELVRLEEPEANQEHLGQDSLPGFEHINSLIEQGQLNTAREVAEKQAFEKRSAETEAALCLINGLLSLQDGDRMDAAEQFEQVLELDPSNEKAAQMLAEMRRQRVNARRGHLSKLASKKT